MGDINMYDEYTKQMMQYAKDDLQLWMATAPKDTTEQAIQAWQSGYIAGIQRSMISQPDSDVEDL